MNSWRIYLLIAWISCHMHHIDIYLDNEQISTKIKIPFALCIKNWGFQLKRAGGGSQNEKMHKKMKSQNVHHVDQAVDQFVRIRVLKGLPRFIFSLVSSGSSRALSIQLSNSIFEVITTDWRLCIRFFGSLEARVLDLGCLLFLLRVTVNFLSISALLGFQLWVSLFLPTFTPFFLLPHGSYTRVSCL